MLKPSSCILSILAAAVVLILAVRLVSQLVGQ
ncbi:hypothetical protein QBD01_002575 [Ochrobactrum sp. 19YEA23]|nr:hypothetical protein [Ochrobactrum sp. 19YEA23]